MQGVGGTRENTIHLVCLSDPKHVQKDCQQEEGFSMGQEIHTTQFNET